MKPSHTNNTAPRSALLRKVDVGGSKRGGSRHFGQGCLLMIILAHNIEG